MDSADRLKFIRKKLKLTQEKLAKSMDLKRDSITSLESRKVKISALHAIAMEHLYGVRKDWLLFGKGEPFLDDKTQNQTTDTNSNVVILKHQGLVTRFKDPKKGLLNNKRLVGIESVSQKLYDKASDDLKKYYDAAMIMKEEMEEIAAKKKSDKDDFQDRESS